MTQSNIDKKFKNLQDKFKGILKSKQVSFNSVKYKQVVLNNLLLDVKKHCGDEWGFTQFPLFKDGKSILETTFTYLKSGEKKAGQIELICKNNDPKEMGASLTYFRRYSLSSMLNLEAYDDEKELRERQKEDEELPEALVNAIIQTTKKEDLEAIFVREQKGLTVKQRKELVEICAAQKKAFGGAK